VKTFKYLAQKMSQNMECGTGTSSSSNNTGNCHLSKYLYELEDHSLTTAPASTANTLDFWIQRENVYDKLSLVASPASQAYAERVFSVCGFLTGGRRNRMSKSLQIYEHVYN